MKRFTTMLSGALGAALGLSLIACLGGGLGEDEEGGQVNACFVSCQSSFGVSKSCFSSNTEYRSSGDCRDKASDYCGASGSLNEELVSDCNCSASCEPEWYSSD